LAENEQVSNLVETVDAVTRARCGALSARGLLDNQIADMLLLTLEQVLAIRETEEFRRKYSEEAERAIQDQIDRDEGWDAVETAALAQLMTTLQFNRDPKFALLAAKTANSADRRARGSYKSEPKTIGTGVAPGQETNIIMININKNYATRENNQIDITPRPAQIPLKQSDMPAPKLVDELLAPAKERAGTIGNKGINTDDIKQMFEAAGVVFDGN